MIVCLRPVRFNTGSAPLNLCIDDSEFNSCNEHRVWLAWICRCFELLCFVFFFFRGVCHHIESIDIDSQAHTTRQKPHRITRHSNTHNQNDIAAAILSASAPHARITDRHNGASTAQHQHNHQLDIKRVLCS